MIVNNDLTDKYHVKDGIDQGEVWSPLLWRIFYDPLLTKLDTLKEALRYTVEVEYKEDVNMPEVLRKELKINVIAFMDDTT